MAAVVVVAQGGFSLLDQMVLHRMCKSPFFTLMSVWSVRLVGVLLLRILRPRVCSLPCGVAGSQSVACLVPRLTVAPLPPSRLPLIVILLCTCVT